MKASENETVAEIAKQMRRNEEVFHLLYWCEYADRIEAAHRREVETARIAACSAQARFDEELAAKDSVFAELRECLKEAVDERCTKMCMPTALTTKNEIVRRFCDNECEYRKWRKALERSGQ